MILFFSGTGNSRHVAERIAQTTGVQLKTLRSIFAKERQVLIRAQFRMCLSDRSMPVGIRKS